MPPGKCSAGQFYCPGIYNTYRDGNEEPLCVPSTDCGQQAKTCRTAFESKLNTQGRNDNYTKYWAEQARSSLLASNSTKRHDAGSQDRWKTWKDHCNSNPGDPDCKERIALAHYVKDIPAPPESFKQQQIQKEVAGFEVANAPMNQNQQFTPKGDPIGNPEQAVPASGGGLWDCLSRVSYLDPISCVACGLEKATGAQGVDRYVGLLGVMAQAYQGTENLEGSGTDIQDLQLKVIGMIADYGYCTNSEYGGNPETSHQKAISAGINRPKDGLFSGIGIGKRFNKSDSYKALGLPSGGKSESQIKTMFRRDPMPTGLQQIRFGEQTAKFRKENPSSPAAGCFSAMDGRRKGANQWNICNYECDPKKPGKNTQKCGRKFKEDRMMSRNSLYMQIAQTCGIQLSQVESYSGCTYIHKVPDGHDPRDPGKKGEPDKERPDRPTGKGDETSGDRGDRGRDGKGGEDNGSRGGDRGNTGGKGGEGSGARR